MLELLYTEDIKLAQGKPGVVNKQGFLKLY